MKPAPFTGGAIRERLALLAIVGPSNLAGWTYNTHTDTWTHVNGARSFRVGEVGEGSASLEKIYRRWHMTRRQVMQLIGYPEKD